MLVDYFHFILKIRVMLEKRNKILVFLILFLAFLVGNFVAPEYWNQTADTINARKNEIKYLERISNIPQFPEIESRKDFKLGLDLQGGTHLVYEADMSEISQEDYSSSLEGLRDLIERRVNLFGVAEPVVQNEETAGHYRLIVELAGIKDPAEAIQMIGQTPFLEFKEQKDNFAEIIAKRDEINKEIESGKTFEEIHTTVENWQLGLEDPFQSTDLTGKYLKRAEISFDQNTYDPLISLQFDDEGAEIFKNLTSKNVGKPLAIYIDGMPISSPIVQEEISGGKAQITGKFTIEEAKELASNLSAGALPVPITLISQQTVGPTLGMDSLNDSFRAGVLGFAAILIFMILFYRLPGFLASLALVIYVILVLSLFKTIPVTLTLAGIGGFILSIGMAVDANVLVFARMREELGQGKSLSQSIEEGFSRAWPSIRDGNLTTLIVALILFTFGSSFVKGFALTLSLGILLSMFSAIFITKTFLQAFAETRWKNLQRLWK